MIFEKFLKFFHQIYLMNLMDFPKNILNIFRTFIDTLVYLFDFYLFAILFIVHNPVKLMLFYLRVRWFRILQHLLYYFTISPISIYNYPTLILEIISNSLISSLLINGSCFYSTTSIKCINTVFLLSDILRSLNFSREANFYNFINKIITKGETVSSSSC